MTFPASPADGATHVEDGKTYVYALAKRRWSPVTRPPFATTAQKDITGDHTINASDYSASLYSQGSSPRTWTLPNNAPRATCFKVTQVGAGQVQFVPQIGGTDATNASIGGVDGFDKTAGQDAEVLVEVISNTTGTNARWAVRGEGA